MQLEEERQEFLVEHQKEVFVLGRQLEEQGKHLTEECEKRTGRLSTLEHENQSLFTSVTDLETQLEEKSTQVCNLEEQIDHLTAPKADIVQVQTQVLLPEVCRIHCCESDC